MNLFLRVFYANDSIDDTVLHSDGAIPFWLLQRRATLKWKVSSHMKVSQCQVRRWNSLLKKGDAIYTTATDAKGHFKLTSPNGDGAPAGKYKVTILFWLDRKMVGEYPPMTEQAEDSKARGIYKQAVVQSKSKPLSQAKNRLDIH